MKARIRAMIQAARAKPPKPRPPNSLKLSNAERSENEKFLARRDWRGKLWK